MLRHKIIARALRKVSVENNRNNRKSVSVYFPRRALYISRSFESSR